MKVSSGQWSVVSGQSKEDRGQKLSNSQLTTHHSSLAFIFPGQGSQYVGMGKDVWSNSPIAKETFEEAGNILGRDMARLCFDGPDSELNQTQNTQPALLTVNVALWRVLYQETGLTPAFLAGHSLGEYTALVVAGALEFRDAVRLVALRGRFMQEAVPSGVGAMAAILGLKREMVEEVCDLASKDSQVVVPANFNSPEQTVISGHKEAVEEASRLAKERGAGRVVGLPVSVPSHSPLMRSAADRLAEALKEVEVKPLKTPVITNVTAEPLTDHTRIKELLIKQLYSPVRWVESILKMRELGVTRVIEIGPGRVLTGLVKRISGEIETLNVEGKEDIQKGSTYLTY